jgi:hypothetical protein
MSRDRRLLRDLGQPRRRVETGSVLNADTAVALLQIDSDDLDIEREGGLPHETGHGYARLGSSLSEQLGHR